MLAEVRHFSSKNGHNFSYPPNLLVTSTTLCDMGKNIFPMQLLRALHALTYPKMRLGNSWMVLVP